MKTFVSIILLLGILTAAGCASNPFFTQEIEADAIMAEKEAIDSIDNPAMRYRKLNELRNKKVLLKDILVKDVIESPLVDYTFCVLAELKIRGKTVECHIYSASINTISRLKRQQSIIDVTGTFQRFFSTLDDYDTKIEITNAKIKIKKGDK